VSPGDGGGAAPSGAREKVATTLAGALAGQDERLSHCVHCGFCLPACPTYVRLGDEADSPRGRLHLMGAVVEGRLDPASDAFQTHIDRCLGCRACESVCPSGVEYGLILERAREVAAQARRPDPVQRLLLGAVERPWAFRLWMWGSRGLRATGIPALLARVVPGFGPLRRLRLGSAMLAASAPSRVSRWKKGARGVGAEGAPAPGSAGRGALLTGCVQAHLFHRVNQATRRVLEANGWAVTEVPDQGCCGALHAHGGRLEGARAMARKNLAAFRDADPDRIGVNAAGCGAAMREYVHLLEGDPAQGGSVHGVGDGDGDPDLALWFSERVRDISELLAGEGTAVRKGAPLPLRVAYDPPCHLLHAQGVSDPPVRMLEAIPGLELVPLENAEECCGGAGIYGITHPELGGRIGNDKVEAVRRSGADLLATGNPGCMMQIGAGLRMVGSAVGVVHPVELLDESYRRAGYYEKNGEGR